MKYTINRPLYFLASKIVGIPVKLQFNLETAENATFADGPAIILVNHESNTDWLITAYLLRKGNIRFIVGRYHFRNPIKRKLFPMLGCLPKEQFYPDAHSIKTIMRIVGNNGRVVLFPSGQSSYSGEGTYIPFETAKLIKRLAIPVYYVRIDGTHLAFPKWDMKKIRKHKILASFNYLFSPEDTKALDETEIYEKILASLYFDDYEWQRAHMIPAGVRGVAGLDHILYMCPVCKAEFLINADTNALSCSNCGLTVAMDTYGFLSSENTGFTFDTPTKWYRWQYREEALQSQAEIGRHFSVGAKLEILGIDNKDAETREGMLSFSDGILEFQENGSTHPAFRENVKYSPILFQHESIDYFELLHQNKIYRFIPESKGAATKFVIIKELCYLIGKRDTAKDPRVQKVFEKLINKEYIF